VEKVSRFVFRIILVQGLNRQIRRMAEYFGYEVTKLERVRIMNVSLQGLPVGAWRDLTEKELAVLFDAIRDSSSEATQPAASKTRKKPAGPKGARPGAGGKPARAGAKPSGKPSPGRGGKGTGKGTGKPPAGKPGRGPKAGGRTTGPKGKPGKPRKPSIKKR
jgi:23S rRNA pseudouridine2604 synthase